MYNSKIRMPEVNRNNLLNMRQWGVTDNRLTMIKDAYIQMAKAKLYRPEAPSDGFGHIQLDDEELADPTRLEMEGWIAARKWYEADKEMKFIISGCADWRNVPAMYLMLEAAQLCCSGPVPRIRGILELAITKLPKEQ